MRKGLAEEYGLFDGDEELYRQAFCAFFEREMDSRLDEYKSGDRTVTDLFRSAADAGMVASRLPEDLGGVGAGEVHGIAAAYEMGRSLGYSVVGATLATDVTTSLLLESDTVVVKELAPRIAAGAVACLAMTEPEGGSYLDGMRTTARRDGDEFVINGGKCYITMGDCAEILFVVARTDPDAGLRGMSIIAVDGSTPGVVQTRMPIMGLPVTGLGEISFENVRVPSTRLIGVEGGAVKMLAAMMAVDRASMSAEALGQAERAYGLALDFVQDRVVGPAEKLVDLQHTRFVLAEMQSDLRTSAIVLADTIRRIRNATVTGVDAAVCKNFIADASARVVDRAVQLHGAAGLAGEYPISALYASNRKFRILAGTSELLQATISRKLELYQDRR